VFGIVEIYVREEPEWFPASEALFALLRIRPPTFEAVRRSEDS
jgi:hypothetical protein